MSEIDLSLMQRYLRQTILPNFGIAGQQKLANAKVLVVGAGGLGSAALPYLAASGVGTLGVVDFDVVSESNLHRQVIHTPEYINQPKTLSAKNYLNRLNPKCEVVTFDKELTEQNAFEIIKGFDLVLDGSDNFETKYLVNDVCAELEIPDIWAALNQFDGRVSVFDAKNGPCYRCVFPAAPPAGSVPSCAEAGVLPSLCAIIGNLQGLEAIKFLVGLGEPLIGRMLFFDALNAEWETIDITKDPLCEKH
jgi:sulfur-carrier protein adenylyltransferase/sulfurtransferase